MNRPYTDITLARANKPIKNGEGVVGVSFTGNYSTLDTHVSVNPTILTIQNKYGNRFYNGSFVYVWDGVDGGGASNSNGVAITPVVTNAPTNTPTSSSTPPASPTATTTVTPTNTKTPTSTVTPTASTPTSTLTATPSSSSAAPGLTPTATATPTPSSSSIIGGINTEAQSWASRVVANGGSVSNSTLTAVSNFCNSIDSLGLRDRFYRLNLICGNNLSASLIPLYRSFSPSESVIGGSVDTNFNLVSGNYTETGSSGGLSGSGFGTGIDTTIMPTNFEDPANFHFASYVYGNPYTQYNNSIMGSDGIYNGNRSRVGFSLPASSANDKIRAYSITQTKGSNYINNGLICTSMDSGSLSLYGGSEGLLTSNYSDSTLLATAAPISIYVLGLHTAGSTAPTYSIGSPAGVSYYSLGRKLTASQYNNLYTALTTFQTALGRNQ